MTAQIIYGTDFQAKRNREREELDAAIAELEVASVCLGYTNQAFEGRWNPPGSADLAGVPVAKE